MNSSIFDVFVAGAISAFLPQGVALLFVFICLLSGILCLEISSQPSKMVGRYFAFKYGIVFFLAYGFSFVFMMVYLARFIQNMNLIGIENGLVIAKAVLMVATGALTLRSLFVFRSGNSITVSRWIVPLGLILMFLAGVLFQLTVSPTIGPVLGQILAFVSANPDRFIDRVIAGLISLIVYLGGFAILGIFVSVLWGLLWKWLAKNRKLFIVTGGLFSSLLIAFGSVSIIGLIL